MLIASANFCIILFVCKVVVLLLKTEIMVHVIPFLAIMELINFIIIFLSGCNLQVSIQKQDEKGRYYVLLFADSGHTRVSFVTKHVAGTCQLLKSC